MSNLIDPQTGECIGGDKNAEANLRDRLVDLTIEQVQLTAAIAKDETDWKSRIRLTEVKNDIASIRGALMI